MLSDMSKQGFAGSPDGSAKHVMYLVKKNLLVYQKIGHFVANPSCKWNLERKFFRKVVYRSKYPPISLPCGVETEKKHT